MPPGVGAWCKEATQSFECPHSRRSSIELFRAAFLFDLPATTVQMNLGMEGFEKNYMQEGDALVQHHRTESAKGRDIFADWRMTACFLNGSREMWLCCPEIPYARSFVPNVGKSARSVLLPCAGLVEEI